MPTVVITGVSRGLGRQMVRLVAAEGWTVKGCCRSAEAVQELNAEFEIPHMFASVDISCDRSVRQWAARVIDDSGVPDLLINNAAIINANAPLWKVAAEEFDRLTAVNINGTANTIRHFVPRMVKRGSGVIVNFSSGWGRSTSAEVAPYCATKWAIEGLTRALADELPPGMAAVPLNPGIINTDMLQSCFGGNADSFPSPEEWVQAAVPAILGITGRDNGRPMTVPGM